MPRIIYLLLTGGHNTGGHKMIVRHVEALREMGFDAVCACSPADSAPTWFDYDVPFVQPWPLRPDDIVVAPDDAATVLRNLRQSHARVVVFSQNPYWFALAGFKPLDEYPPERFPTLIAVSEGLSSTIRRAYPAAEVHTVPCFADERLFRPADKRLSVAFAPRKRRVEAVAIRHMFEKFHPRHADLEWVELLDVSEAQMAAALGRACLYLSLNRLESVGITTLEAMASGCVCAGFTGVGGREYAVSANGFWAAEEDCEAAADALAQAADVVKAGGPRLLALVEGGRRSAEAWSHARFRDALGETWRRILEG